MAFYESVVITRPELTESQIENLISVDWMPFVFLIIFILMKLNPNTYQCNFDS